MSINTIIPLVVVVSLSAVSIAVGMNDADKARIAQIAAMLPAGRFALGAPITDRAAWERAARHPAMVDIIKNAELKVAEPVPAMTLEIYGQFKKSGQRTKEYMDVRYARHERIALYTLAECVENKGRFLAPLEAIIASVCAEPTWLYNFHDGNLDGWNGKGFWIDLGAVMPAADMSQALALLGDRLSPATRHLIVTTCRQRIIDPYRQMVETQPNSWAYSEMNWNAVCHAGVVTTALALLDDREERAYFVAMAEKLSVNYLHGLGEDGYCSEGTGYWNYGFGHYAEMSELILQATGGKVNLFDLPGARTVATYPTRMEIINGLSPSYADCPLNPHPDGNLFNLLNGHYDLGLPARKGDLIQMSLRPMLTYVFPNSGSATKTPTAAPPAGARDYFEQGGVLVCRPTPGSAGRLGVSIKGGNNNANHGHNDLGTFVVAVGHRLLILDPGLEVYAARTFSKDRFQSKLLNSYGHPVPVIAGRLQRQGAEAVARVLKADFSDARDVYVMDLRSAYEVPQLRTLTRTFAFDRAAACALTVEDDVAFDSPQTFSTALVTFGSWTQTGADTLRIEQDGDAVDVKVDTGGVPFTVTAETIDEPIPGGVQPTRIAIGLKEPIAAARVKLLITPGVERKQPK